jgi:ABC-type bacteriocin/lantibiotic exporter with double-glycine peptidase domain
MIKNGISIILVLLSAFGCVSTLSSEESAARTDEETEEERNMGDMICGPKCVHFLLDYYGKEQEDIIRLVREIQYPEIREGATLEKVAAALEQRGIHTFAMKIKPSARLVWKYPVIVHLNPRSGEQIGHYVVWFPDSHDNNLWIWNGDEGMQNHQERTWSKERSGAVLLTSPEPINKPGKAVKWVGLPFYDDMETIIAWLLLMLGSTLMIRYFHLLQLFQKGVLLCTKQSWFF